MHHLKWKKGGGINRVYEVHRGAHVPPRAGWVWNWVFLLTSLFLSLVAPAVFALRAYNTKHTTLLLPLALLMFWILTNNHYLTLTANKTTIFTNFANWTTNFHILSPEVTGIDCHRIYESIYLGSIPILKTSELDYFYEKLPVLIVKNF